MSLKTMSLNGCLVLGALGILATDVNTSGLAQERPPAAAARSSLMVDALRQSVPDFAIREQSAPADVRARLETLRRSLAESKVKTTFTVGYTTAFDIPIDQLTGLKIPKLPISAIQEVNRVGAALSKIDHESALRAGEKLQALVKVCSTAAKKFDWRTYNKVTPVKAQICGTCWDFAAMGAFEGSWAIRNNQLINASEQYILNCASAGSCSGGWYMPVFNFMIAKGNASETSDPFTGNDSLPCPPNIGRPYSAAAWAFVPGASTSAIPTVTAIKQALCEHGPLATAVYVDTAFQAYTGGVFVRPPTNQPINHAIVIIGWDDANKAWLIKNSWGMGWGETGGIGSSKGYMWIRYTTNKIGTATAWVDAKKKTYVLNPSWASIAKKIVLNPTAAAVK